jgi:uncharacterized protein
MRRVWIDLANSPHVAFFGPVVDRLRAEGITPLLTVRDHAQTAQLARRRWAEVELVGGESPPGRAAKARSILARARALQRFARRERPDVALSHGSYAQLVAARAARIPAVTMMDYEFQPANHVSFRAANRVLVPEVFPSRALHRFGARGRKVVRYPGFKEQLYLAGFTPDARVPAELGVGEDEILAVFRPPPSGALYHRMENERFDEVLDAAAASPGVRVVLLPRTAAQADRYGSAADVIVPERAVDGLSLLAAADLVVGGGGTMNREASLLGTPTYTIFGGRLAAVDAELIRRGLLHDLRPPGSLPRFAKKPPAPPRTSSSENAESIMAVITSALGDAAA